MGHHAFKLTPRETEVLTLLARGLASKEVAYELGLSLETIRSYTKRLYKELGAHNRAEAVHTAIAAGLIPNPVPAPAPTRLSAAPRPLIGREAQLRDLSAMVERHRLVTVVGMGGVGKTALALEAARRQASAYTRGAAEARLEHVTDEPGLIEALASALQARLTLDADPWDTLGAAASGGSRLLFVDNFEQLGHLAERLGRLLAAAPDLRLLVTARRALGVPGEAVLALEGLRYPTGDEPASIQHEAVALFVDELGRHNPGRALAEGELASIGEICRMVGGVPLAVVLAAAWGDVMPLAQIVSGLHSGVGLLMSESLVPERHRRIDLVIGSTIALLAPERRAALARLSVCRGGFDRAAVASLDCDIQTLGALVRSALIRYDSAQDRYTIHSLVGDHVRRTADAVRVAQAERTHRRHFSDLVGSLLEPLRGSSSGPSQSDASKIIEREMPNISQAWLTGLRAQDLQAIDAMLEPLVIWFDLNAQLATGVQWIRTALRSDGATQRRGRLKLFHDWLAMQAGAVTAEEAAPGEALRLAREQGASEAQLASALIIAAFVSVAVCDAVEDGLGFLEQAELAPDSIHPYWDSRRLMLRSLLLSGGGDTESALDKAEEMLNVALDSGDLTGAHLGVMTAAQMGTRLADFRRVSRTLDVGEQLLETLYDAQTEFLVEALRGAVALWEGGPEGARARLASAARVPCEDNASMQGIRFGLGAIIEGLDGRIVEAEAAKAAIEQEAVEGLWPETAGWAAWGVTLAYAANGQWAGAQRHLELLRGIESAAWCPRPEYPVVEVVIALLRCIDARDAAGVAELTPQLLGSTSRAKAMYRSWLPLAPVFAQGPRE